MLLLDVTGQSLVYLPSRPVDTATWVLEDLHVSPGEAGRELASGVASVDLTVFVLDGDAGGRQASSVRVPLASTAGLEVEDAVWLEGLDGAGEQLEVAGVVADDYTRTRYQLVGNYEAGAELRRLEMSAAIPDLVTADESLIARPMRITWEFTLEGKVERRQEVVELRRASGTDGELAGAMAFARAYFPQLSEQERSEGQEVDGWARLAKELIESDLRHLGEGIEPTRFLTGERANQLIGYRLLIIAARNGVEPKKKNSTWAADLRTEYTRIWDQLTIGTPGLGGLETNKGDLGTQSPPRSGLGFGL